MNPASHPHYSFRWSQNVVAHLYQKHTRATDFALEILDISTRQLAAFLANGDPMWVELRKFIQDIEIWQKYSGLVLHKCVAMELFQIHVRRKYSKRLCDRLTPTFSDLNLEEQGSDRGLEEASADSSLPLLDFWSRFRSGVDGLSEGASDAPESDQERGPTNRADTKGQL